MQFGPVLAGEKDIGELQLRWVPLARREFGGVE